MRQMSRDAAKNSIQQRRRMDQKKADTVSYRWNNENKPIRKRGQCIEISNKDQKKRNGKAGRRGTLTVVIMIAVFCVMALILKQIGI